MSDKAGLRVQRVNTVINTRSKKQEKDLSVAVQEIQALLLAQWPTLKLQHESQWSLAKVTQRLAQRFPNIDFHHHFDSSSMRPDGGILSMVSHDGEVYPILISEKKNQGTNDARKAEDKSQQAKGNAIERLGKNVIGLRLAMRGEMIFPFVCFGDGCDFAPDSSILDRVSTIAMFGKLNTDYVHNAGPNGEFNRGSFYFRETQWTKDEMAEIGGRIAMESVRHYFSTYGEAKFL